MSVDAVSRSAERLIGAAERLGLSTDGVHIWSDQSPAVRYRIVPDLTDRLAKLYASDDEWVEARYTGLQGGAVVSE